MVLYEVPFFKNKGKVRCVQAAMRSVSNYFLGVDYSLEELDEVTRRVVPKGPTWGPQTIAALHRFGLKVRLYDTKWNMEKLAENAREHIRKLGCSKKQLRRANFDFIEDAARLISKKGLRKDKKLTLGDLEHHLDKGHLPIAILDHNLFYGGSDSWLHDVVIVGYDSKRVYYHESGARQTMQSYCSQPRRLFRKAWNVSGRETIMVFGPR